MPTIKEVAEEAGVSVTTVSRTLNNRGYISQETRARIDAAMKKLNYRPNELARSLLKQRSGIIGVMVPSLTNPYFAEVVAQLAAKLSAQGYKMMLCVADGADWQTVAYIDMLKANQVDGIIVAMQGDLVEMQLSDDLPVVSFERLRMGRLPTVICDNMAGGRLAAQELLDCGCRYPIMAGVKHSSAVFPAYDRFRGFTEVMEAAGLPAVIHEAQKQDYQGNYQPLAAEILDTHPSLDGIFCSSDSLAESVVQEAVRRGIRIPADLKVVGYNDSRNARTCAVPLTTIRQPLDEMSEAAVACLRCQIQHEPVQQQMLFPVSLIRRASTRGFSED